MTVAGETRAVSASAPNGARQLRVRRLPLVLAGDDRRVILLPFGLSDRAQVNDVLEKVAALPDDAVRETMASVMRLFRTRHRDLPRRLEEHCSIAERVAGCEFRVDPARRHLIAAMLTMEYSLEAAALFNPSIVPHPDQSGLGDGQLRFVMSIRAVGEGHLSSIVFRTGVIEPDGRVSLDPAGRFSSRTRLTPDQRYLKPLFRRKAADMDVSLPTADAILEPLGEWFTLRELEDAIAAARRRRPRVRGLEAVVRRLLWLARSNYRLQLEEDATVSELILFPRSEGESHGMEDLRLVRFRDDDGSVTYYGTYTAFDGEHILPMLLETADFRTISVHTLNGACVQNKGMALFPRKVGGHYVMCSRIDGRNLYLMFSDMVHFWESATLLARPKYPWELRLIGNCGSPLETPEGWLLFTHGVGPMRRYCIGAMLLDLDDPFRIRGRLRAPLIEPTEQEREGHVPNVVYSCGALVHRGWVLLPYAVADTETHMATIELSALLERLIEDGP